MKNPLIPAFLAIVAFPLCTLARPQDSPPSPVTTTTCSYSCPPTDYSGGALTTKSGAIGYDSPYSIFECVYRLERIGEVDGMRTCAYYKNSGSTALSLQDTTCPAQALPCTSESHPVFSNMNTQTPETPPWVESGRWWLFKKENPSRS